MSCLVGIDRVKWLTGNIMLSSSCLNASENVVSFFLPFVANLKRKCNVNLEGACTAATFVCQLLY